MPRYIEGLNECTDPASDDVLWVVDASAPATDKDRKLSLGKLAVLALAQTFTALQTYAQGVAIGVAANKLYRPAQGVVRQRLEWVTIPAATAIVVCADTAYAVVLVCCPSLGQQALFNIEGGASTKVFGSNSFSGLNQAGTLNCFASDGVTYVQNRTEATQTVAAMVWE